MKSIRNKLWAKLLAAVLLLLCLAMSLACFAGVTLFREYGMYGQSEKTVRKNLEQNALTKYSVTAMYNYLMEKDEPLSEQFRYAIYQGTVDPKNIAGAKKLAGNSGDTMPASAAVHTFQAGEDPDFQLAESIFDEAYIYGQFDASDSYDFEGFALIDGMDGLYIRNYDNTYLYRIDDASWQTDTNDKNWKTLFVKDKDGTTAAIPRSGVLFLNSASADTGSDTAAADVEGSSGEAYDYELDAALTDSNSRIIISSRKVKSFSVENWIFTLEGDAADLKTYTVLSYADRSSGTETASSAGAAAAETASSDDFFRQGDRFADWGYRLRYPAVAFIPVSLLLGLLCFLFLLWAAGHREQDGDQIVLRGLDRVPTDLFALVTLFLTGCAFSVVQDFSYSSLRFFIPVLCLALLGAAFLLLLFCMNAAVNWKAGTLWKRSLTGRLLNGLRKRSADFRRATAGISMKGRIWFLFGLFVALELLGMIVLRTYSIPFLCAWLFEKVLFFLLLAKILREFGVLKQAGAEIASGNMDFRIDTEKMFLDFEEHGKNLNCIGSGLAEAVEERIRSERMKTELITNVSHDIKTPLTSIISYTDLLARLDLNDPQAQEYIEVLSRQSERLKKLIEDLIEASKASSGTLKMDMENVDAGVVLAQAAGEFDEKLRARGIDYYIKKDAEDPIVRADSRYLWRIFENLMSNICKYAQPGTRAYIDMNETDRNVSITFRNVSEAPLHITGEELKARFVQGDSSRAAEGSGLGLSIADSLAQLMGGELNLTVDGDLFKVELLLQKAGRTDEAVE